MALTKNEKRKRNDRLVKNRYGNVILARRAREWSDKRLYNELGIKVTDSIPEIVHHDERTLKRKDRELDKFIYAKDIGLSIERSRGLVSYSKKRIKSSLDMTRVLDKPFNYDNRKAREDLWSTWSAEGKTMPPEIDRIARYYNKQQNFDNYDRYGYAFAFFLFVENEDEDATKQIMAPNKFTGEAYYAKVVRVPN